MFNLVKTVFNKVISTSTLKHPNLELSRYVQLRKELAAIKFEANIPSYEEANEYYPAFDYNDNKTVWLHKKTDAPARWC